MIRRACVLCPGLMAEEEPRLRRVGGELFIKREWAMVIFQYFPLLLCFFIFRHLSLWTSLQSRWFSAHFSATCFHLSNMQATVAEVMELDCTQLEFVSFKWSVNWSELCTIGTVIPISISLDGWCSQYLWINCVPYNSIMWNISIYLPNKVLMNTFEMKVLQCIAFNASAAVFLYLWIWRQADWVAKWSFRRQEAQGFHKTMFWSVPLCRWMWQCLSTRSWQPTASRIRPENII